MNNRESFKEMVKMLKAERERLNEIAGLLNGKTTVGGDLIYSYAAKVNVDAAYKKISDAIEILACEYIQTADPDFHGRLSSEPDIEVYFDEGFGTEHINIYADDIHGNRISTQC